MHRPERQAVLLCGCGATTCEGTPARTEGLVCAACGTALVAVLRERPVPGRQVARRR